MHSHQPFVNASFTKHIETTRELEGIAMSVMKYFRLTLSSAACLMAITAHAGNNAYNVELNKTEIVRLSEPAAAVIIGNPQIADVSVHSSDTIFVIGRGYGKTNLIIMNTLGQTIMNADIQVTSSNSPGNVRLYAGADRASYHCSPYCLPAPVLGDSKKFIGNFTSKEENIQTTTISAGGNLPPGVIGLSNANSTSDAFGPEDQEIPDLPFPE